MPPADVLSVFCAGPYGRRTYDDVLDTVSGFVYTGFAVASNRVSYMLGLVGACMSIDCASASALVAVHMAAGEARQGRACHKSLKMSFNLFSNPLS
jgi:acyl transferase domain-containing protein